jgi:hypothetical protein
MFILVYFQGRPTLTLTQFIFMGDLPSHSHWYIFRGDLPTHVHPGLFSGATGPHMFILIYFHGRPTLTLTRFIFMGDLPSHSLPTHVHPGLLSGATGPHMFILVYFQG